jgi:hypothetical protein
LTLSRTQRPPTVMIAEQGAAVIIEDRRLGGQELS